MRIKTEDIDLEKFFQLKQDLINSYQQESAYKNQVEEQLVLYNKQQEKLKKQMINVFHKGYWWSYDVDRSWRYPKKYSIKEVCSYSEKDFIITVKEVVKKKPYPGFKGEYRFDLEEFLKIDMYETEEEAKQLYPKRACPKCGKAMGFVQTELCKECMVKRKNEMREFEASHVFYHTPQGCIYIVGYENNGLKGHARGFGGQRFILRRLDNGEIIETTNLQSYGFRENDENLPEIEFIGDSPK